MPSGEIDPLIRRPFATIDRSKFRAFAISSLSVVCALVFACVVWNDPRQIKLQPRFQSADFPQPTAAKLRKTVLYQDWRGLSQEEEDTFTFVHTWSGDLPVGEREEQEIDPKALRIDFIESETDSKNSQDLPPKGVQGPAGAPSTRSSGESPGTLKEVKSKLEKRFNTVLVGEIWSDSSANALLSEFDGLCGSGLLEAESPITCDLTRTLKWSLTSAPLGDDISIDNDVISVSTAGVHLLCVHLLSICLPFSDCLPLCLSLFVCLSVLMFSCVAYPGQ